MQAVVALFLIICFAVYNPQEPPKAKEKPPKAKQQEIIVYVTKTGGKYHRAGCQYLRRSSFPISLKDAKASLYSPCSRCRPPQ